MKFSIVFQTRSDIKLLIVQGKPLVRLDVHLLLLNDIPLLILLLLCEYKVAPLSTDWNSLKSFVPVLLLLYEVGRLASKIQNASLET